MAGLTISIGSIGPSLAEGKAVASRADFAGTATGCLSYYHPNIVRGLAMIESVAIYCFVVSMILLFANPFWNHVITTASGG
jgi:F-type H+-transporting ATPase subunit c